MSTPKVFISYSHKDKDLLGPLVAQLKALEQAGLLEVWDDTRIDAGDKWYPEIEAAMKQAAVAVCLVSEYFLASDFCTKQEVPFLLKRSAEEGLLIIPVLLSECVWETHRWLKETQMLPGEGQSVRTHYLQNPAAVFVRAAKRIHDKLSDPGYQPPTAPPVWLPLGTDRIDLTRLPETGAALFGREQELELLDDAWASLGKPIDERMRILAFTAHGGVGKSTLVNHWLAEMARDNYRGASRVFGWSFFSQGVRDEGVASADSFIDAALRFFGDSDPTVGSAWDKGERLAGLIGSQPTLLVLDGMEPLQSSHEFERGKVRDPALESLLRGLSRHSAGLCLVTTREPLPGLAERLGVTTRDLEQITPQAGRALLRTARVVGTDAELEKLAERFGPHALAVSLLGVYLYAHPGHGIGPADALEQLPGAKPIDRVLAGFEQLLGESAEREVLQFLGFFDRPADAGCLGALRNPPVVSGLNERVADLDDAQWDRVLDRLEKLRLIHTQQNEAGNRFVDAHPLIREHFAQVLKGGDAWREGHKRLYEHLCATTNEGNEPTLEDLQPLYRAVAHGCHAGLQQEACDAVYFARILRRNEEYSWRKLGLFGSDLSAIACFFETQWSRVSPALTEADQAWMLNEAFFRLRALGRLTEALEPLRPTVRMNVDKRMWQNAAACVSNLSQLELTLGEIAGAVGNAAQSVTYADRSRDALERMSARSTHADGLHQTGRRAEAETRFREAEEMQAERQPAYTLLYSLPGFQYCDLLLAAPERDAWRMTLELKTQKLEREKSIESCRYVSQRVAKMFGWRLPSDPLLDIALEHLTLGRAALCEVVLAVSGLPLKTQTSQLKTSIATAVEGLRRAASQDHIPRGLLTRAWLRFLTGARTGSESAQEDLDEAWEIAERGPMRLFMADIHLYRARLFGGMKDEGGRMKYPWDKNPDGTTRGPKDDLAAARKLIEQCGYGRRKEELEDAEEAAKGW
jgi:tetratricopeptide (TPR) repeat protein